MKSDSKTCSIERHAEYGIISHYEFYTFNICLRCPPGKFNMNMLQATGSAGVPTLTSKTSGAAENGGPTQDSNWPSIIHAVVMALSFVVMMPLGVIFIRILERVRWHWVNQILASGAAIVATGLGLYLASMFNKSKNYGSAHQILGLVVTAGVCVQFFLGYWHHRLYKKTKQTTVYAPNHRHFGQLVVLGGVINGGIGLSFSRASMGFIVGYSIAVIVVAILTIGPVTWKQLRSRSGEGAKRRTLYGQDLSADGPWDDSSREQSNINLTQYPSAPAGNQPGDRPLRYEDRDRV